MLLFHPLSVKELSVSLFKPWVNSNNTQPFTSGLSPSTPTSVGVFAGFGTWALQRKGCVLAHWTHCRSTDPLKKPGFECCSCSCDSIPQCITSSIWNIFFLLGKMVWSLGYLLILPVPGNSGLVNPLKMFRSSRSWNNSTDNCLFQFLPRLQKFAINKTTVFNQLRKSNKSKALAIHSSVSYIQCFSPSKYSARPFH